MHISSLECTGKRVLDTYTEADNQRKSESNLVHTGTYLAHGLGLSPFLPFPFPSLPLPLPLPLPSSLSLSPSLSLSLGAVSGK